MSIKDQLNHMKLADIAALMEVNIRTVQRWVDEGLPRHGEGQGHYYVWAEVRAWDKARLSQAGTDENDRNRKERLQADLLQLELNELSSKLVRTEEVEESRVEAYSRVRSRLLAVPSRLAGRLVDGLTREERQAMAEDEIHQALLELSRIGDDAAA